MVQLKYAKLKTIISDQQVITYSKERNISQFEYNSDML